MTVVQAGQVNLTAQQVPGIIVAIQPPGPAPINGVPSNIGGIVGTATWGPVGVPVMVSDYAGGVAVFGQMQARKYDMMTVLNWAAMQGKVGAFSMVRVTDGTDVAASAVFATTFVTLTSRYTGTLGNSISAILAAGTAANTVKLTITLAGFQPEVFDNIPGTGATQRDNIVKAVNLGNSQFRGPSTICVATAGAGSTGPTLPATINLTGGTDGATTITGSVLLGTDTAPRKGLYALRKSGASVIALADCDDSTTWSSQIAYGLAEGAYMQMVGPAGDTISTAVTTKSTAGIDSYAGKVIFGDWVYVNDTVNNQVRLISPQAFALGLMVNQSPEKSTLNKQLQGIVATQRTYNNQPYSNAELLQLVQAGIDVLTNPSPGGKYFSFVLGVNTSSDQGQREDCYTRMTNYIAYSIDAWGGKFVGELQGFDDEDDTRANAFAGLDQFLANMKGVRPKMIDDYKVVLDKTNNPDARIRSGWMQGDVQVRYMAVVRNFLVNLQGGQTTVIVR
ncbi:phage tail protein [Cupriavidus necator]|uniref:phage tail protein n=1 Tax=Cupriavidus necator TaxID=106590 RepID=UPI00148FE7C9|nr:phage tail protein [Cupriavidus necator]NOV25892.1 phage tail protein [Cupriavidus necator]